MSTTLSRLVIEMRGYRFCYPEFRHGAGNPLPDEVDENCVIITVWNGPIFDWEEKTQLVREGKMQPGLRTEEDLRLAMIEIKWLHLMLQDPEGIFQSMRDQMQTRQLSLFNVEGTE